MKNANPIQARNKRLKEIERKQRLRNKKKLADLDEASFWDMEFLAQLVLSALMHVFIFLLVWQFAYYYYGPAYHTQLLNWKNRPPADIVFWFVPNKAKKGQFTYDDAKKIYKSPTPSE